MRVSQVALPWAVPALLAVAGETTVVAATWAAAAIVARAMAVESEAVDLVAKTEVETAGVDVAAAKAAEVEMEAAVDSAVDSAVAVAAATNSATDSAVAVACNND